MGTGKLTKPKSARLTPRAGASVPRLRLTDEFDVEAVSEALRRYFSSNEDAKNAKKAFADLIAAGCDERIILQNLYFYCGGDPEAMKRLRGDIDFPRCRERMRAIGELLLKASSEIQVAEKLLADLDINTNVTPDTSRLESYANLLKRLAAVGYRKLASKRISGRDQHLVFLSRMIEIVTGRPRYREIADLVNTTRLCYDADSAETDTAESIRKRVDRNSPNWVVELEVQMTLEKLGHSPVYSSTC